MRNQLRLLVLLGGASVVAGATFLVACGDDTSVTTDAGADAQSDAPTTDAPPGDGGADTAPPFDGGFKVDTFDKTIAEEICKSLARCCYGNPTPPDGGVDGGSFDKGACEAAFIRIGFEGSNANTEFRDGGKVGLDQVAADSCITKIKAMTCDLPGAEFKTIRAACFSAYAGTVAAGGACKEAIECQPGHFCKGAGDGGTGVCEALRPLNGNCGDFTTDPAQGDRACSYRAGGGTGNYCDFYDIGGGVERDPADWKCASAGAAGSDCASSLWCSDTICSGAGTCVTPDMYFAGACDFFATP
jgi:hypothetical protein